MSGSFLAGNDKSKFGEELNAQLMDKISKLEEENREIEAQLESKDEELN